MKKSGSGAIVVLIAVQLALLAVLIALYLDLFGII